jgi:lactoylglutathione lyase
MLRFHVHVGVEDLGKSVAFYSALFGAQPVRLESDYAKWQLEDPPLNFAISARGAGATVQHLGFEAETAQELILLEARAKTAGESVVLEKDAGCCYARSDKAWVADPQGIQWENFLTHEKLAAFGDGAGTRAIVTKEHGETGATKDRAGAATPCCAA